MKNILFLVTFLASLFTSLNTDAQCPNNNSPYGTISSLAPGQTSTVYCMYGGEYATVSVVSGAQYTFSTCGGSWDSQLTLRTTTGTYLAYNDDGCGLQSQINWTATFSGQVRVILDKYYCSNYNSCMNLNVTRGAAAVNPCNSISSLSCGTTGSFSLSGSGSWNNLGGPFSTPGSEKVFSFTPTLSGVHAINVTASSGYVDLYYKSGACGSTGWTYVDDIIGSASNNVTLTAGVTYYFLLDDENTTATSGSMTITCPTPAANPCNSITNIAACGSSSSFSLSSGTGSWSPPGPWGTPGKEAVFSYTPPTSGAYDIQVLNSEGWVDLFYKTGTCSSSGWTYVSDILSNETNTVNLVGGVTYLFLIDDENTSASSGSINISCPCIAPPGGVDDSYTYNGDFTISGTTVGACNDCSLRSSNDRVYAVNISCAGDYTFATCGSSFDTYLYLNTAACGGSSIAINDDACGLQSSVTANLQPGTYYIHVEGFSSTSEGAFTMYVSGTGSAPSITGSATNATCFGASNGSITANVNGNGNTASATLNGASFNGSASGLAAGSYTLSASNCWGTSSQTFTVGQPTPLVATISSTAPNTTVCNGGTAPLTASVSGGSGTVNYQWQYQNNFGNWVNVSGWSATNVSTPFTNSRNASPSTTRAYRIVVTSSQNSQCTVTATQLVTVIPDPVFTITSTNVTCNGLNNGTATAVLTGGLPLNYGYNWFSDDGISTNNNPSGDGTLSVSGLFPAEWVINTTVSLSNFGCFAQSSVIITQPALLVAASTSGSIACKGGTTTVSVSAAGGTAPYSGDGNYTVGAGTYSYTVTDANGCTSTTTITVSEPTVLTSASTSGSIACNGGTTTVSVSAAGGTAPYSGTGSYTVTAGTYSYTVTDANGCTSTTTITVSEPTVLTSASTSGSIACKGGTTTVSVSAAGGTAPYSGDGNYTVGAGTYSYTVTDANGCTSTTTITVSEPTVLTSASTSGSIACNGGTTTVSVSAAGGTAPYSGDGNYTVGAGTYSYTITDANGCASTTSITVTEPTALGASNVASDFNGYGVSCNGGSNGSVNVSATGGTTPYSGDGAYTNLSAGNYSYTVTDANGCTASTSATITEPTVLTSASTSGSIACNGGTTTVSVSAAGGTAPYSGDGDYTVGAGTYSYTVTDANGCTSTTTITVSEPTAVETTVGEGQTVFYGYAPMACATISGSATGGTPGYTYSWSSNGTTNGTSTSLTVCPTLSTTYTLTATDILGCTSSADVYICVVDVRCNAGNSTKQKVEMCQIPEGNPANAHTICVDASAVPALLAIGCVLGACDEQETVCPSSNDFKSVDIEEEKLSSALSVYPNPTSDRTTVSLTVTKAGEYKVVLYNTMGQVVNNIYNGSIAEFENQTFDLNMTDLEFGVYILAVSNEDGSIETVRVVKQ